MTTVTAARLSTELISKLVSTKTGLFLVVKKPSTTVTIDEDGVHNTVPINRALVAPTRKKTMTEDNRTQTGDEQ